MTKQKTPINIWKELINNNYSTKENKEKFMQIYDNNSPSLCEFTVNSFCPNRCRHCIYPQDYHICNNNIDVSEWEKILTMVYNNLKMKTFIINGRSINENIFNVILFLKEKFSDCRVGLIIDGTLAKDKLERVKDLPIDWIDVSVDGFRDDHDNQRSSIGSFNRTVEMLDELKNCNRFDKINILTTLTTINLNSVIDMIRYFNNKGFLNFFITPVTIYNNKPNPDLKISMKDFKSFFDKLLKEYKNLSDSFVNLNIFDVDYFKYLKEEYSDIYKDMRDDFNSLMYHEEYRNNVLDINFYPNSLNSTREFIINSDGRNILPLVIADSKIEDKYVFCDLKNIHSKKLDIPKITKTKAFDFYVDLFLEEKEILS